ncbi:hypothetical protein DH2020_007372 [Rehmannia glutinosa]|uniref:DUF4283 domain-containing protein n=1 Tax=Rehmannia glutinosa TaxID=99300 RepID=A0ABR0TXX3_REHGL
MLMQVCIIAYVLGFSSLENDRLAKTWKLTLIGKFSFVIPHPKGIASGFSALNLEGPFSWSFANPSHIIIKLHLEEDYNKLWMGTTWSLGDCPIRVFKWTPSFNPRTEAPLAQVWIRLPGLPIHFFDHNALFAISKIIGSPLQVDSPTTSRTRLSMARVCVELDLLKERIVEVILEFDGTTHVQKIIYERIPDYCTHCKHIGHSIEGCCMNGNKTRPPPLVRRPTTQGSLEGHVSKGQAENIEKFRDSKDNSKNLKDGNPISNPNGNSNDGGKKVASNNPAWIMVNKKGAKETGVISKELLDLAKKSKHTYFEASYSNTEESSSNQFSILAKEAIEPLDKDSQLMGIISVSKPELVDYVHILLESTNHFADKEKRTCSDKSTEALNFLNAHKDNSADKSATHDRDDFDNRDIVPCKNNVLSASEKEIPTHGVNLCDHNGLDNTLHSTKLCLLGPPLLNMVVDDMSQSLEGQHQTSPSLNLLISSSKDNDASMPFNLDAIKGINLAVESSPIFLTQDSACLIKGSNSNSKNEDNIFGHNISSSQNINVDGLVGNNLASGSNFMGDNLLEEGEIMETNRPSI